MAVFTATEVIDMALRAERNGETFYTAAAKKMGNAEIKELLQELAAREREHYRIFEKLADQVADTPNISVPDWDEYNQYVGAALQSALFGGADKALAAAEELEDEQDTLRMALGFEKDTLLFYYDLRDMMGREADRQVVEEIIREEKKHARRLGAQLRALAA